jgi:diguanylate cyclase (GGDEF)-like protein/PAS domain S-box-containing protein
VDRFTQAFDFRSLPDIFQIGIGPSIAARRWGFLGTLPRALASLTMSSQSKLDLAQHERASTRDALERRESLVRILFVHRFLADVERCSHELERVRFTVSSDVVVTPEQFAERLRSQLFDLVVAEYPSPNWQETQVLDFLGQMKKDIPLIFLVHGLKRETAAEFILRGAADCIEVDSIGHLPVAVHRALAEKALRDQRDRAEKELRRSEARYRALAGNRSYGICRCSLDGRFLEVNEAMMRMLGYGSREELLALDLARDIIQDPDRRAQLLGQTGAGALLDPIEIEWKRADHATVKVRLSGREVLSEQAELEAYEVIAEDVTRQRELEDRLRQQAASDSLTGLANYRHLVDVLDSEIKRSKRTNREFAMLFFDLDGLKRINERHGHMIGSQALCRLADVLCSCCRDIDTPARFGGDEFALVLPETNAEAANLVARRICASVANDGKGPKISVSVGIAVYPQNGDTIESLLCKADARLYSEKRQRILPAESRHTAGGR